MLKLLVDLSYTQSEEDVVTGIYLYGKDLTEKLSRENKISLTVSLLKDAPADDFLLHNEHVNIVYLYSSKNSKAYWRELSRIGDRFDAVFFPYQVFEGRIRLKKAALYMTIHDLTPLREVRVNCINRYEYLYRTGWKSKLKYAAKCVVRFSHLWYWKRNHYLKYNAKRCYHIFTDSRYSRNDIIHTYSIPENRVTVAYSTSGKEETVSVSALTYRDYFLLISAGRYLKNACMALFALDDLWSEGKEKRNAIVTGNLPKKILKRLRHPEKVIRLGYVSEGDLEYLYQNAYCFIFPSLSEGFGLPPAEAMKYGTKTICSDAMSLKELYHDTILFNPYSKEDIKEAICKANELRPEQMRKIYESILEKQKRSFSIILHELLQNEQNGK